MFERRKGKKKVKKQKEKHGRDKKNPRMHPSGIEPEPLAWKASMIPFHHGSHTTRRQAADTERVASDGPWCSARVVDTAARRIGVLVSKKHPNLTLQNNELNSQTKTPHIRVFKHE